MVLTFSSLGFIVKEIYDLSFYGLPIKKYIKKILLIYLSPLTYYYYITTTIRVPLYILSQNIQ